MNIPKGSMKGSIDLIYGMISFFALVIVFWVLTLIFQVNIFQNTNVTNSFSSNTTAQGFLTNNGNGFFTAINTVIAFVYIFFGIAAVIAAALSDADTVYAVIAIAILPIEILLSFGFHDAFFNIIKGSAFATIATTYPLVQTVFQWYPVTTLILALILIIVTFSKD